ncbi:hypothetical protein FACS1894133_6630 [Clostridia bacterium]|nr:hypothetical protein FACS1894133_6630 [Clostridia bacterium]
MCVKVNVALSPLLFPVIGFLRGDTAVFDMAGIQLWFNSLPAFTQVMYCIAIPSSLIVIIQAVLLAAGLTGAHAGVDFSDVSGLDGGGVGDVPDVPHDVVADVHTGEGVTEFGTVGLFSVQGVCAFLCVFGWSSIVLYKGGGGVPAAGSLLIALVLGFAVMYGVAALLRAFSRLVQDGTTRYDAFAGASAVVYLKIPAGGVGKVSVNSGGRMTELDATAESDEVIETGASVTISRMTGTTAVVQACGLTQTAI